MLYSWVKYNFIYNLRCVIISWYISIRQTCLKICAPVYSEQVTIDISFTMYIHTKYMMHNRSGASVELL